MDNTFKLTVAPGSVIHRANGSSQTLTDVPENALEIWEGGSATLSLTKAGAEILKEFSQDRLKKVIQLRRPLKNDAEMKLLQSALKALGRPKKTEL